VVDGLADPVVDLVVGGASLWGAGEVNRSGVGLSQRLGMATGSCPGHQFLADHAAGHLAFDHERQPTEHLPFLDPQPVPGGVGVDGDADGLTTTAGRW
jgi:hypothetical protein